LKNNLKEFTYLGLKYRSHDVTFRLKDLDKALKLAEKWMKEHYGTKFIGFEFRSDLGNKYVARIGEFHPIGTHLNDSCTIQNIGTQWRVILYYRQPISEYSKNQLWKI